MRASALCALLGVAGTATVGLSAAQASSSRPGGVLARGALVRRADLGRGWSVAAPPPHAIPPLTCPRDSPSLRGAKAIAKAASPTYEASADGPFVSQTGYSYRTGAQQARVWHAVVRPALLACVAATVSGTTVGGVAFSVTHKRVFALPRLPARAAGYSVSAAASSGEVSTELYLDTVVLGAGRTITELSVSSFSRRDSAAQALRLARVIARRLS